MKFNLLMILICVIALAVIAFRMGFELYRQPAKGLQMNYNNIPVIDLSQDGIHPTVTVTSTPQGNIWTVAQANPKLEVKQVQCYKFLDNKVNCQ
jgi:hypothetical protein